MKIKVPMNYRRNIETVVREAKKTNAVGRDLIDLYESISLEVYKNQEEKGYECIASGMGFGGIDWTITVPKGEKLPTALTNLFFNDMGLEFKVTCKKVEDDIYEIDEDAYNIFVTTEKEEKENEDI